MVTALPSPGEQTPAAGAEASEGASPAVVVDATDADVEVGAGPSFDAKGDELLQAPSTPVNTTNASASAFHATTTRTLPFQSNGQLPSTMPRPAERAAVAPPNDLVTPCLPALCGDAG